MVVADDEAGTVASDVLPFLRASCPDARRRPSGRRFPPPWTVEETAPESWNGSYPTFPPPLRVSYSIQIPKTIRLKSKKCRALSSPPLPQAPVRYTCVQRPQRRLAGVFSISGSHLVRLVPQLESGQNCSDGLFRLAQAASEGLSGSYERRPTWISSSDPKTLSATVVF